MEMQSLLCFLTVEQIEAMSVEEINAIVREALTYDDYRYQKENGIRITEPFRAEGLHKVLYQCPHCREESRMTSAGTELRCAACGKRWNLNEDGTLSALEGETEFSHVPDWFLWQRQEVRRQVREGTYRFEDEVEVFSLPRCWRFEPLGKARLTHDAREGFRLEGFYRGEDYHIQRLPLQTNSLHIEYDYCYIKPFDCVDISTEDDSFYCYPTRENVVTKLAFATEEIYLMVREQQLAEKAARRDSLRNK